MRLYLRWRRRGAALGVALTLASLCWVALARAQQFPAPRGYVNDFANVIDDGYEARITAVCQEVKRKTGAEIAVVTMPTIGDYDYQDFANRLFEAWGIGEKGKHNGLLIFNAVGERKIWIEVGYGLEGAINDARAGDIYRDQIRPYLQQGEYGKGLLAGTIAAAQLIAAEYGVTLEREDLPAVAPAAGETRVGLPICTLLFILLLLLLLARGGGLFPFLVFSSLFGPSRRGGPWGGGFGGGFGGGGFGGGFGGFGGGASGGGGAGGGY